MKPSILLVDDTEDILTGLQEFFTMEGFLVLTARNGKEALSVLATKTPDVIVTDLLMDEMNGFELVSQVRSQPQLKRVFVIVFSARPRDNDKRLEGIDAYILKPADPELLVSKVNELLNAK